MVNSKEYIVEKETMSAVYGRTLLELMRSSKDIVDVEADLGRALLGPDVLSTLVNDFPDQFIDCGIQESNMISVAAGLSIAGKIPFAHSFAAFASRRVMDQTFISGAYNNANIKITGSNPGICPALDGGTHCAFEDVAMYRAIPGMTIVEPADNVSLRAIMHLITDHYGMTYLRLFRKNPVKVYDEKDSFTLGKANLLREGKDVTIFAQGILLGEALVAADMLADEGISARVTDMFTTKPLDSNAVVAAAKETGAIVTCENHSVVNGLGSAVADVLAATAAAPLEKIGVRDRFGEVGPLDYLKKAMGLTAADICEAAKRAIARK